MARKTASRLDKRREVEAAEKLESSSTKKKTRKKATKKKTTRKKKTKAASRTRLVWVVYGGNMKEESRFPYDQRAEADAKVEQLLAKGKKLYFVQPVKEPIEGPAPAPAAEVEAEKSGEEE